MDRETTRQFLTCLWGLQAEAGLTNAALSRAIGCDDSYIRHLKTDRAGRPIGLAFVMAAVRRFPSLRCFLLPTELPVSNTVVPDSNDAEERAS